MQGDELKAVRKAAGLSQAEMGERLGISRVTIGQMERGDAPITNRTAKAVQAMSGKVQLVRESFTVVPVSGLHVVVRRTLRKALTDHGTRISGETVGYGFFRRRDHAWRWANALNLVNATGGKVKRARGRFAAGV